MKAAAVFLAALVVVWLLLDGIWRFSMTGSFFPVHIVEHLNGPVGVKGWTPAGLELADGRRLMPKGMLALPKDGRALAAFTSKGVEVKSDGTIYGLVEVFHGCGNDSVTLEIRRIDIGKALTFLRVGTSISPPTRRDYRPLQPGGLIGESGWNSLEAHWYLKYVRGEEDPIWDIREANAARGY